MYLICPLSRVWNTNTIIELNSLSSSITIHWLKPMHIDLIWFYLYAVDEKLETIYLVFILDNHIITDTDSLSARPATYFASPKSRHRNRTKQTETKNVELEGPLILILNSLCWSNVSPHFRLLLLLLLPAKEIVKPTIYERRKINNSLDTVADRYRKRERERGFQCDEWNRRVTCGNWHNSH